MSNFLQIKSGLHNVSKLMSNCKMELNVVILHEDYDYP